MQHLDEGLLMAMLDGELTSAEQREVAAHLKTCSECVSRLEELRGLMGEADGLVEAITVPPATPAQIPAPKRSWITGRNLAWAASVVAALGLGIAGTTMFTRRGEDIAVSPGAIHDEAVAPNESAAAPTAPAPEPQALATRPPAVASPSSGVAEGALRVPQPAEADEARRENPGSDLSANIAERAAKPAAKLSGPDSFTPGFRASGFASSLKQDSPSAQLQPGVLANAGAGVRRDNQVRPNFDSRARRQAAAQASAALTAPVPRDEVASQGFREAGQAAGRRFAPISMEEAVRQLDGVIRLLDGLTPEEFEVAAADSAQPLVRVLYRIGRGETSLYLEQNRTDTSLVASDLQVSEPVVIRSAEGNRLSWNDLHGFHLTLFGPVRPDSLFHFKTLVK